MNFILKPFENSNTLTIYYFFKIEVIFKWSQFKMSAPKSKTKKELKCRTFYVHFCINDFCVIVNMLWNMLL